MTASTKKVVVVVSIQTPAYTVARKPPCFPGGIYSL
jgi:hypothetical protein